MIDFAAVSRVRSKVLASAFEALDKKKETGA
jgi:hypothetical protein